jgi:hypothetical protein
MLAKVMPHLKVGAQKWTAQHVMSVGGRPVPADHCLQVPATVLVFGPAGWFQKACSRLPRVTVAMAICLEVA